MISQTLARFRKDLDELFPWLILSALFMMVLAWILFCAVSNQPMPLFIGDRAAVFRTEVRPTAAHPHAATQVQFLSQPVKQNAALAKENQINTITKKMLYQRYLIAWQNAVVRSAYHYMRSHAIPRGTAVVRVRVLPNGQIDRYRVMSSTNRNLDPYVTRILLDAAPYPRLPKQLAGTLGIVIERTWRFE